MTFHAPEQFEEYPGGGIRARAHARYISIGSPHFIEKKHISLIPAAEKVIEDWEKKGATVVLVALNQKIVGCIALEDEVKPEVARAITLLSEIGIDRVVLLTGDNELAAAAIAQKTGIHEYYANCKPDDKVKFIQKNRPTTGTLVFVGDGVNDAASLSAADASFAMGAIGADSAIESADIAIMDDKFSHIYSTIKLAKFTKHIVVSNFIIWGVVNVVGIYLVFAGLITPPQAALFNFATDFLPLLNSFRLFNYSLK